MEMQTFASTAIASAQYDAATLTLRIWFTSDPRRAYNYYAVPPHVWMEFRSAQSPGRYFHMAIEDTYSSNQR